MRVLYFHQHFSTRAGSTGTRSYEFARKLIELGHQVTMVCGSFHVSVTGLEDEFFNGRRRGMVDGIEVIELRLPYSNKDPFLIRILTFLRFAFRSIVISLREPHDLVFATSTPLTAGIPGIFSRWFRGKRFVFEVRDLWPELPRAMGVITNPIVLTMMSVLEWVTYHSAHYVIGLSPGIVRGIQQRGIANDRTSIVSNGCDLSLCRSETENPSPLGVEENDFVAVFAGALGVANGLNAVLDVAEEVMRRGRTDIKFVFVGEGSEKAKLIERVKAESLSNCRFLHAMPKAEMFALLRNSDVGVMCLANVPAFYYGTSPNKFFDYIAAGLPVINNYPGWLADLIGEYDCGIVVSPDDPAPFADALILLSENIDRRKEMGENSSKLATERFDRNDLAQQFSEILEGVWERT